MPRIARNAAVYIVGNVVAAGVPFFLLPLLTRALTPDEYGSIAMFMALLVVVGAFTGLNVHGAINVRYFEREAGDFPRFVGSCFFVLLASSSVVFLVAWLFRAPLSGFVSLPVSWVLAAVVVAALNGIIQIRLSLWLVREQPVAHSAFQFGRAVFEAGLSLYLVFLILESFEGRLWGRTGAMLLFATIALATILHGRLVNFRPQREYVTDALRFGVPLVPHVVGTFLIAAGDRFIINAHLGLAEAGIYLVAVQIGMAMQIVAEGFNRAFVPWLYRQLRESDPAALRRIVTGTWLYFASALLAAAVVALLSTWIVSTIAGPDYRAAASALGWIAFGQAFNGMYLMVTNYTFYAKKTGHLAVVTLSTGVIALTLTFLLVPVMGIAGAGLAFAIAMLLKFLLTWVLAQRVHPMPWFRPAGANWFGRAG